MSALHRSKTHAPTQRAHCEHQYATTGGRQPTGGSAAVRRCPARCHAVARRRRGSRPLCAAAAAAPAAAGAQLCGADPLCADGAGPRTASGMGGILQAGGRGGGAEHQPHGDGVPRWASAYVNSRLQVLAACFRQQYLLAPCAWKGGPTLCVDAYLKHAPAGTGERVAVGERLRVEGLKANETYMFAVAGKQQLPCVISQSALPCKP